MSVVVRFVLGSFAVVAVVACSGGPDDLPPEGNGYERTARPAATSVSTPAANADGGQAECVSFETRECTIDLGVVNGVHNCAKGQQICESGAWTECASF